MFYPTVTDLQAHSLSQHGNMKVQGGGMNHYKNTTFLELEIINNKIPGVN